ncbi:MAG TPA: hypothetical protein VGG11_17795 [Xanthobacteraceae bacterium]
MAKTSRPSEASRESQRDPQYDAIYAEIVSTHHGRRFLAEYARRHDCTAPQSLVGTIARIESSFRNLPPTLAPASLIRSLLDLAEAIERLEAAVATRRSAEGPRETEALLNAAMDAATREINAVIEGSNAATVRSLHGVELLRDVRRRVGHMVALLIAIVTPELAGPSDGAGQADADTAAKTESRPHQDLANRDALKPLASLSEEEVIALFS